MTPNNYEPTKNPSSRKSIRQFLESLDVKHKTYVSRLGTSKANRKANRTVNALWFKHNRFPCS